MILRQFEDEGDQTAEDERDEGKGDGDGGYLHFLASLAGGQIDDRVAFL